MGWISIGDFLTDKLTDAAVNFLEKKQGDPFLLRAMRSLRRPPCGGVRALRDGGRRVADAGFLQF